MMNYVCDEYASSLVPLSFQEFCSVSVGYIAFLARNKKKNCFDIFSIHFQGGDNHCSVKKYAFEHEGTVQYDNAIPKLEQFTACVWMRFTNHSGDHVLFTYSGNCWVQHTRIQLNPSVSSFLRRLHRQCNAVFEGNSAFIEEHSSRIVVL